MAATPHIIRAIFWGLLVADCHAGGTQNRDLFLVAGQSNAVGFNAKRAELPESDADHQIPFWWRCGDPPPDAFDSTGNQAWSYLQPQPRGNPNPDKKIPRQYGNFAEPDGGFGPEIGFGRTLLSQHGAGFAILKVAFNGTELGADWNPADSGEKGACYRALVEECRAGIADARNHGIVMKPRALIWVQGESDANARNASAYAGLMRAMIAALRKDIQAPDLAVLTAFNTRCGGDHNLFVARIVAAQKEVAATDARCLYVDTSKEPVANRAHFNTQGILDMGTLFAKAWLQLQAKDKS